MIDPNTMSQGIAGAMPQIAAADPQRRPQGTVSKDLLDALAAAKLLREKQAAQNQLMLSMENDPQTVVAKNQGELEKRSLDEVARGVSGVLQNKQRNAQKRMNALASGQRRGRPPQGLASARMAQAAAQQGGPRRMAQGGIVGFQEGQEVEGEDSGNVASRALNWVKENPAKAAEYASYGLMFIPGVGLAGLGARAALAGATKLAPRAMKGLQTLGQKAVTKPVPYKPKPGQTVYKNPKTGKMETLDPAKRTAKGLETLPTMREFSPMRAGIVGSGPVGYLGTQIFGEDEATVETPEAITEAPPSVTPSAVAQPAVDSNLPTYQEKMTKIERALAQGGIESFAKNMQDMDEKEAEREIQRRKNELLADYNRSVVDQRSLDQAQTQLLKYSTQLQTLVSQDPMVLAAQRALEEALDDGDESDIAAAQKAVSSAQGAATASIGKTPNGRALISQIAALKETLSRYQGGSATVDSSGFGELKITG